MGLGPVHDEAVKRTAEGVPRHHPAGVRPQARCTVDRCLGGAGGVERLAGGVEVLRTGDRRLAASFLSPYLRPLLVLLLPDVAEAFGKQEAEDVVFEVAAVDPTPEEIRCPQRWDSSCWRVRGLAIVIDLRIRLSIALTASC